MNNQNDFEIVSSESVRLKHKGQDYLITKIESDDLLVVLDVTDPLWCGSVIYVGCRYGICNCWEASIEYLEDMLTAYELVED